MIFNTEERKIIRDYKPQYIYESIVIIKYHMSELFQTLIKTLKLRDIIRWLFSRKSLQ